MRRLLALTLVLLSTLATAQERKAAKEQDLKKASSASPDKSLAGDLTRKKEEVENAPALRYDQFRLGVETQVASKRKTLIEDLQKIIKYSTDKKEKPKLYFQLAELYWEEAKYYEFDANRKDDDYIQAMNRKDVAGQQKAKNEKARLLAESKKYVDKAVDQYKEIVQNYRDFERMDEVLYFLGNSLMDKGEDRNALTVFKRLIDKYKKSKYVPDAWLAFGEYYFNTSKGKREFVQRALQSYQRAAEFTENQGYMFAIYKQGWCYFNLADYDKAMERFATVILYGKTFGAAATDDKGGPKGGKATLVKEARNDYVRTYERLGGAMEAKAEFGKVTDNADERFEMLKKLADLYYGDGKDRDAAVAYNLLIKEKPLSPEAPGFQGRIVDCVMRAGNKKQTVEQVRRLVKVMDDVQKGGVIKTDKDKEALTEARELSERTLSNLAVNWHNEAKKTRDEDTFDLANQVYADYLTLFPENPKAYDLRFFWAEMLNDNLSRFDQSAEQYTKVALQDIDRIENGAKDAKGEFHKPGKPGKWFNNALYNAILAYDQVVAKAQSGKPDAGKEASNDFKKKLPIAPEQKALLDACDRYVKYQPQGEKRVEIAYKAALILYQHNYFDEAVPRFADIAMNYPDRKTDRGDRMGEIAANLVLDSFNILSDWEKVNEWARKFYSNEKLAVGTFRADLAKLIEASAFKLVNQMEASKNYAKAAEAYMGFVAEFPRSAIADKALYNASIDFHNAQLREKALAVRQRIVKDYPKSEFVPGCIYSNAETHEAIGDFDEASDLYESYAAGYERSLAQKGAGKAAKKAGRAKKSSKDEAAPVQKWEEPKAQVALFNAAVFREGLGQLKQALKDRERYLALWPAEGKTAKDAEPVFLSVADLYEKMGAWGKALDQLEDYERKYLRDSNKVLITEGRLIDIFQKTRRPKDVARIQGRVLKYYGELSKKAKAALEPKAVEVAAAAHLARNEADYQYYLAAKLRWGKMPRPEKEFKATLQEKFKRLKVVQDDYTQTVGFKAGDPAICALYKIGLAYDNFAQELITAPLPKGLPQEFEDAFREEIGKQAEGPKAKATDGFEAAVAKSRELDIYNDCARRALTKLREEYAPDKYPAMIEKTEDLAAAKLKLAGGDILAAIQEVPVVTAEQVAEAKDKAEEIREATSDVGASAKREEPRDEPKAKVEPEPRAEPKSEPKKDTDSEEPEDFLQ